MHAFWSVLTEQQRQELFTLNRQHLQHTALELTQAVSSYSCKPMWIKAELLPLLMLPIMEYVH